MRRKNYSYYLCLERTHYMDGSVGDVEVHYTTLKPKIGDKYETVFWFKGYDTAVGYEACKELTRRVIAYKGKISNEFAKDLAMDVIKNFDDNKAMWDYETKITKIGRELEKVNAKTGNCSVLCRAMKNIEKIVRHQ